MIALCILSSFVYQSFLLFSSFFSVFPGILSSPTELYHMADSFDISLSGSLLRPFLSIIPSFRVCLRQHVSCFLLYFPSFRKIIIASRAIAESSTTLFEVILFRGGLLVSGHSLGLSRRRSRIPTSPHQTKELSAVSSSFSTS
jgi:hypothetical protein